VEDQNSVAGSGLNLSAPNVFIAGAVRVSPVVSQSRTTAKRMRQ
jgi:hypothetical protein